MVPTHIYRRLNRAEHLPASHPTGACFFGAAAGVPGRCHSPTGSFSSPFLLAVPPNLASSTAVSKSRSDQNAAIPPEPMLRSAIPPLFRKDFEKIQTGALQTGRGAAIIQTIKSGSGCYFVVGIADWSIPVSHTCDRDANVSQYGRDEHRARGDGNATCRGIPLVENRSRRDQAGRKSSLSVQLGPAVQGITCHCQRCDRQTLRAGHYSDCSRQRTLPGWICASAGSDIPHRPGRLVRDSPGFHERPVEHLLAGDILRSHGAGQSP